MLQTYLQLTIYNENDMISNVRMFLYPTKLYVSKTAAILTRCKKEREIQRLRTVQGSRCTGRQQHAAVDMSGCTLSSHEPVVTIPPSREHCTVECLPSIMQHMYTSHTIHHQSNLVKQLLELCQGQMERRAMAYLGGSKPWPEDNTSEANRWKMMMNKKIITICMTGYV